MAPAALILDFTDVVNASSILYPGLTLLSMYSNFLQLDAKLYSNTICQGCCSNETYKALPMHTYVIGAFINFTFFSLQSFAVQDVSGVMVNNVTSLTISGTTTIFYLLSPRLIGFTFSLDDGNITLTFDQEVFANTFINGIKLTTQNHMTAPIANYTYQNGAPINLQPTVINLFPDEVE